MQRFKARGGFLTKSSLLWFAGREENACIVRVIWFSIGADPTSRYSNGQGLGVLLGPRYNMRAKWQRWSSWSVKGRQHGSCCNGQTIAKGCSVFVSKTRPWLKSTVLFRERCELLYKENIRLGNYCQDSLPKVMTTNKQIAIVKLLKLYYRTVASAAKLKGS